MHRNDKMIPMKDLKPIDYKLLFELMKDSHRSDRQLAKALGVSQPTVTRRRAMLEENFIEGYTVIPKFGQIGFEISAFTFIKSKLKHKTGEEKNLSANHNKNHLEFRHCFKRVRLIGWHDHKLTSFGAHNFA